MTKSILPLLLVLMFGCGSKWQDVVRDADAWPLQAPSADILPPGSVAVLWSDNPVKYTPVCSQDGWFGPLADGQTYPVKQSTTVDQKMKNELETSLNATIQESVKSKASYESKSQVKVSSASLKVIYSQDWSKDGSKATKDCKDSIRDWQGRGFAVSLIWGNFVATIDAADSAKGAAGAEVDKKIVAGSLGISAASESSVFGKELIWGVNYENLEPLKPHEGTPPGPNAATASP